MSHVASHFLFLSLYDSVCSSVGLEIFSNFISWSFLLWSLLFFFKNHLIFSLLLRNLYIYIMKCDHIYQYFSPLTSPYLPQNILLSSSCILFFHNLLIPVSVAHICMILEPSTGAWKS